MNKNYLSIYAKSFNWAGFFLPKNTYSDCSKLYDFCRTADNIADDQNSLELKNKIFYEFKKAFNKKDQNNSIIKNMWGLIEKFNISPKIIEDLFDGIHSDIKEAMQLTNISRDGIEDEINNRSYINANLETIKSTIFFADKFYDNSFYAMKKIPLSLRFSIIVARRIYRKIGHKIIKIKTFEEYKNSGKIFVNNYEKILETLLSIFDLIKLTTLNNDIIDHNHDLIEEEININERI